MTSEQSEDEVKREVWENRKPSYTETAVVDVTADYVDDLERDIDEISAIADASAISALEALKA